MNIKLLSLLLAACPMTALVTESFAAVAIDPNAALVVQAPDQQAIQIAGGQPVAVDMQQAVPVAIDPTAVVAVPVATEAAPVALDPNAVVAVAPVMAEQTPVVQQIAVADANALAAQAAAAPMAALPGFPMEQAPQITPDALAPLGMVAASGQPTPGAVQAPVLEEKKEIYLSFDNTELASFIEYIADIKKLNIVYEKPVEGSKISLSIRDPLSVEGAWNVFLTVLDMSGFALIEAGPISKIISKEKKLTQPLPAYINVPWDKLPDNDSTIRYVTFLTNLQVGDIRPVVEGMLSGTNSLLDEKNMNAFIITDKASNIRAAAKLLHELDQMGLPESVTVLRLKRVNALDAKELLDSLIKPREGNPLARLLGKVTEGSTEYFSPTTRVIAEERSNSLILLGNEKSIEKIVNFITNHFDTELKTADSPLHVYELQHINAQQVAELLKEVTTPPESGAGQAASKFGATRGGVKYFRPMKFQVDKDGNRLIVSCVDKNDWELLKKTLDDLDKPQPQVALESMIVTINVKDEKNLGGQIRNKKHDQIGKNIDFQSAALTGKPSVKMDGDNPTSLLGNLLSQLAPTQGQMAVTIGKANDMWAVFRAIKSQDNASIISQPFVTIANKTEGTIDVGQELRVVSEETEGESNSKGYISLSASTNVKITPQINLDGMVRMDIKVNISDFINAAKGDTETKVLETNVTVADGQVLVLGGFVKTKVTEQKNSTPVLSNIPVLGWFFKAQKRSIEKQYIFLFISPTIIKPRQQPGMQLYTKMKLHNATTDIEDSVQTKRTQDPIYNWFFNSEKENYSHKVIDFANARYQPTTVDIKNDLYYRSYTDAIEAIKIGSDEPEEVIPQQPAPTISAPGEVIQPEQQLVAQAPDALAQLQPMPLVTDVVSVQAAPVALDANALAQQATIVTPAAPNTLADQNAAAIGQIQQPVTTAPIAPQIIDQSMVAQSTVVAAPLSIEQQTAGAQPQFVAPAAQILTLEAQPYAPPVAMATPAVIQTAVPPTQAAVITPVQQAVSAAPQTMAIAAPATAAPAVAIQAPVAVEQPAMIAQPAPIQQVVNQMLPAALPTPAAAAQSPAVAAPQAAMPLAQAETENSLDMFNTNKRNSLREFLAMKHRKKQEESASRKQSRKRMLA